MTELQELNAKEVNEIKGKIYDKIVLAERFRNELSKLQKDIDTLQQELMAKQKSLTEQPKA